MRKRLLRWLIGWLLPGFHLHGDPVRKEKSNAPNAEDETRLEHLYQGAR